MLVLFSMMFFSNNTIMQNTSIEDYKTINPDLSNNNAYAVEFADDDDSSFDYVFDPSEYIDDYYKEKLDEFINEEVESNTTQNNEKIEFTDDSKIDEKEATGNTISTFKSDPAITTNGSTIDDFNFAAVGDWDCKSDTKDTVKNIINQDPELVLALGDLSYNGKAKCWLKLIEPFADKTKIVIGNHEIESSKLLQHYMTYFGLEKQYYSFTYKNIHFLVLSTEIPYEEESEQYEFVEKDLQRSAEDPSVDWTVALFHRQTYSSGGGPDNEDDFRETYHPLFDEYEVDLALQGHLHAYERLYPISFNHKDDSEPIVTDSNHNHYENPPGTIFITAGTGGAHDMKLSSQKYYSANGVDGEFGILNIDVENNGTSLRGSFIGNDENRLFDQFEIVKSKNKSSSS